MSYDLRLAREDDAEAMLAIYGPFVRATATSFEMDVPSLEEFRRRIASTLLTRPWLALECDGALAGYAYADAYRARKAYQWAVEVSVYVGAQHWKKGIGRALYTSLFEILKLQGFATAFAIVALPNPTSVAFHESMGFDSAGTLRAVGFKLGYWHDVGWWQIGLGDRAMKPELPIPLPALIEADGARVQAALDLGRTHLRP